MFKTIERIFKRRKYSKILKNFTLIGYMHGDIKGNVKIVENKLLDECMKEMKANMKKEKEEALQMKKSYEKLIEEIEEETNNKEEQELKRNHYRKNIKEIEKAIKYLEELKIAKIEILNKKELGVKNYDY